MKRRRIEETGEIAQSKKPIRLRNVKQSGCRDCKDQDIAIFRKLKKQQEISVANADKDRISGSHTMLKKSLRWQKLKPKRIFVSNRPILKKESRTAELNSDMEN